MVLTYPKHHGFYVDFGTKRVYYPYYVLLNDSLSFKVQQQWCSDNFKVDTWWSRYQIHEFAFVYKKDAIWFALKWS
jgi:hypothetical protein